MVGRDMQPPTEPTRIRTPHVSAEFELVLACCGCAVDPCNPKHPEAIDRLLTGTIRWADVLRILNRHRVQRLAHRVLDGRNDVPADIQEQLAGSARKVAQQNILAAAHATRLCKMLEAGGIQVAVLKGLPLC